MKIDNPEVRVAVAKNAAKRTGTGPWEAVCGDLEVDANLNCRHALVVLARADNKILDQAIAEIKDKLGDKYSLFIRRYNKAYRGVEAALEKSDVTVKKAAVEEEKLELTAAERKLVRSLKKEIIENPTVAAFDKYTEMADPLSPMKAQLVHEILGKVALRELVRLRGVKAERVDRAAEAQRAIIEKLPRSEIEDLRKPGPDMWDIDVEIFYPIALGVATGRIAAVSKAIENFGWIFDGRALPELVSMTTILMMDKYEGNMTKLLAYYSSVVVSLGKLHAGSLTQVPAHAARKRMENLLGIEDVAGEIMRQLSLAVIAEGE